MTGLAQLISDTIQVGGSLVFIEDHAPADLLLWIEAVQTQLKETAPWVLRKKSDLIHQVYRTRPQDLIFIFPSQHESLVSLQSHLQGQRVLLGRHDGRETALFDLVWNNEHYDEWISALHEVVHHLSAAKKLENFAQSFTKPCLFLDRDDVIVKNVPYNTDPSKVQILPGVVELIHKVHQQGYWVAMVSNQSGLGRGRISWAEYQQVHQRMLQLLAQQGAWLDDCIWASYIENSPVDEGRLYAGLRKPRSGMFQIVQEKLRVNMALSIMIGDSASDLVAAADAGLSHLYLVRSEKFDGEVALLESYRKKVPAFSYKTLESLHSFELN